MALIPLAFDYNADIPFGVTKALVSHSLAYALAGVIAGLFIQFGREFFVRSWMHIPVAAFAAANVLSAAFAADWLLALYGTHERMLGLGTVFDGIVLYFAVVLLVRTRSEAVALIASALAASALVLGYELVQLLGRDPFNWNSDVTLRPFSTLGQTNSLAEYLTVIAVVSASSSVLADRMSWLVRGPLLAFAGIAFGGVAETLTRSSLLGVLAGGGTLLLLTWIAHPNRRARTFSLLGAVGAALLVSLVLFFTPFGARVLSTVEISASAEGDTGPRLEASAETRVALYRIAFEMLRDRPLLGFGPDNFLVGVPRFRSADEPPEVQESPATSAHGWPAQIPATTGILGLFSFLAIVAVAAWVTLRAGYRPAAWISLGAVATFLGAGLTTVNAIGTEWILWIALGGVAAATAASTVQLESASTRPRGRNDRPMTRSSRLPAALACVLIGFVMALTTPTVLAAAQSSHSAQTMRLQGKIPAAIGFALDATQLDPQRPEYWESLGLAYVAAERFQDAAVSFAKASGLAPYDIRYSNNLARAYAVLVQRGDASSVSKARDVADRGVRTDPNNPLAHLTRAVVMQITGDLSEALRSVDRALALDKSNNRDIFLTATQVLRGLGRNADAIAMARRGIGLLANPQETVAIRIELARALLANGDPLQAAAELDAVLAIRPNDSAAQQLRAQIRGR